MTIIEAFSRIEKKMRPFWTLLPPRLSVPLFTFGRKMFLSMYVNNLPYEKFIPSRELHKRLWNIDFGTPLFNAAGMFKNGDGYYVCAAQGAGAFLSGTTTSKPRTGNIKNGVKHPFAAYPRSDAASNWMGLPNHGHESVARKLSEIRKVQYCPIGASISADPDLSGKAALDGVLYGLQLYEEAGVDFIELNESCPNVPHDSDIDISTGLDKHLINRLEYIKTNFLDKRNRNLPVIVKFSTDTSPKLLPELLSILLEMKFDGVNLGNTSTEYNLIKDSIDEKEQRLFDYFTREFGGGVSGNPLKSNSYALSAFAANYIKSKNPSNEFHVIRTGGISTYDDVMESEKAGIKLNQWFSGYFDAFSKYGHKLYLNLLTGIK